MYQLLYNLLCIAVLSTLVRADPSYFINPPASGPPGSWAGNEDLTQGSQITLQWYSNISSYSVTLWQQGANNQGSAYAGTVYSEQSCRGTMTAADQCLGDGGLGVVNVKWTVTPYNTIPSDSPVYYLWLGFGQPNPISCHYFNMTTPPSAASASTITGTALTQPTTSTSIQNTQNAAVSTASTVSTAVQTTQNAAVTTTSNLQMTGSSVSSGMQSSSTGASETLAAANGSGSGNSSSSSATTVVGLGVGLGVGIPLVLVAAGFLGLRIWNNKKAAGVIEADNAAAWRQKHMQDRYEGSQGDAMEASPPQYPSQQQYCEVSGISDPVEAPGNWQPPVEAPAHSK